MSTDDRLLEAAVYNFNSGSYLGMGYNAANSYKDGEKHGIEFPVYVTFRDPRQAESYLNKTYSINAITQPDAAHPLILDDSSTVQIRDAVQKLTKSEVLKDPGAVEIRLEKAQNQPRGIFNLQAPDSYIAKFRMPLEAVSLNMLALRKDMKDTDHSQKSLAKKLDESKISSESIVAALIDLYGKKKGDTLPVRRKKSELLAKLAYRITSADPLVRHEYGEAQSRAADAARAERKPFDIQGCSQQYLAGRAAGYLKASRIEGYCGSVSASEDGSEILLNLNIRTDPDRQEIIAVNALSCLEIPVLRPDYENDKNRLIATLLKNQLLLPGSENRVRMVIGERIDGESEFASLGHRGGDHRHAALHIPTECINQDRLESFLHESSLKHDTQIALKLLGNEKGEPRYKPQEIVTYLLHRHRGQAGNAADLAELALQITSTSNEVRKDYEEMVSSHAAAVRAGYEGGSRER